MKQLLTSVVREICTLRSVGAGVRVTAPGHPVGDQQWSSYRDLFDPVAITPATRWRGKCGGPQFLSADQLVVMEITDRGVENVWNRYRRNQN